MLSRSFKLLLCAAIAAALTGIIPAMGADAALPSGPYLNSNQKAQIGSWEIQVSNGIKWTKELKGDLPGQADGGYLKGTPPGQAKEAQKTRKAQSGMSFAMVPVTIRNTSDRTASLLVGVWNFYDVSGRMYMMLTLGLDFIPSADYLNMKDFGPGETRKGYLPFELPEGIDKNSKYVQLVVPLVGSATWKL